MSRIDDLVKQHCPDGVEFRSLDELFTTRNGYTPSKSDNSNWTGGTIPWFRMEDLRENGKVLSDSIQHIPESAVKGGRLFPANSILIATSATIGEHALITVPHLSNQRFTSLTLRPEFMADFDMKFVYYYCFVLGEWCKNNTTMSSFASVDMTSFKKFLFPIPPIEVQKEIVKVLDTFSKLEAELEAELEARRKQYTFYRDQLLTFTERERERERRIRWARMTEVSTFIRGTAITARQATPGDVPVVANGPIPTYSHSVANRTGETVVVARSGAYAGLVSYWNQPIFLTDAFSVHPDESVLKPRFVYYLLQNSQERMHAFKKGAGVPHVRVKEIENYVIPIPTLEEQEHIISILDKFDALVNDLSHGLPAELNARRQQYEHYRDRLLTFQEAT